MFMRVAAVTAVCLLLASGARAEEYRGHIVKVEKDALTLSVSHRGDIRTGVRVNPPVNTEFAQGEGTQVLNIRAQEVNDDATKKKIVKPGEYVIIKTEKRENKETVISIQAVGG